MPAVRLADRRAQFGQNVRCCAGFSDACITKPSMRSHEGVREAPRHEIAGRKGLGIAAAIYGDLRRAIVWFREVGTTDALHFDGLISRGERAPPALGSGLAWRRRSQDVGRQFSYSSRSNVPFSRVGGRGSGLGGGPVLSFSKQINYIAIALPTCARARIVNSIISFIRAARPERAR